jgi:putative ABC transport system permease protein
VLLVLLAAAALVFVIACSNVANLILARSVRREGELAMRAALGASAGALRRTLLAESLLLCGAGAMLGVALAGPMVRCWRATPRASRCARSISPSTPAAVGGRRPRHAGPRCCWPSSRACPRPTARTAPAGLSGGSVRITAGTNRRLRLFAVTQIAASLRAAGRRGHAADHALRAAGARDRLQHAPGAGGERAGVVRRPRAEDLGVLSRGHAARIGTARRRARGRRHGGAVARRRRFGPGFQFTVEGYAKANGEEDPRARFRTVSPGFFARSACRSSPAATSTTTTADERSGGDRQRERGARMFPSSGRAQPPPAVDRPGDGKFIGVTPTAPPHRRRRRRRGRRERGAGTGDDGVPPGGAGIRRRPAVRARQGDPYALVAPITRIIRELAPEQPVEQAATLEDVRAEVLAPNRLNALVFGGFAGVALMIAVVGVAGVLAFSVSARTREFGVRLAIGSEPRHLLPAARSFSSAIRLSPTTPWMSLADLLAPGEITGIRSTVEEC